MEAWNCNFELIDPRVIVVDHRYQRPEKADLIASIVPPKPNGLTPPPPMRTAARRCDPRSATSTSPARSTGPRGRPASRLRASTSAEAQRTKPRGLQAPTGRPRSPQGHRGRRTHTAPGRRRDGGRAGT